MIGENGEENGEDNGTLCLDAWDDVFTDSEQCPHLSGEINEDVVSALNTDAENANKAWVHSRTKHQVIKTDQEINIDKLDEVYNDAKRDLIYLYRALLQLDVDSLLLDNLETDEFKRMILSTNEHISKLYTTNEKEEERNIIRKFGLLLIEGKDEALRRLGGRIEQKMIAKERSVVKQETDARWCRRIGFAAVGFALGMEMELTKKHPLSKIGAAAVGLLACYICRCNPYSVTTDIYTSLKESVTDIKEMIIRFESRYVHQGIIFSGNGN